MTSSSVGPEPSGGPSGGTPSLPRRVAVVGCPGSGKTTFARQLAAVLRRPLYHLDDLYWHEGWVPTPPEQWREIVATISAEHEWIIDGNYHDTLAVRVRAADVVVVFDLGRWVSLWRVLEREAARLRGEVDSLPRRIRATARPRVSAGFVGLLRFVFHFRERSRPRLFEQLADAGGEVVVLRSDRAARAYLRRLEAMDQDGAALRDADGSNGGDLVPR